MRLCAVPLASEAERLACHLHTQRDPSNHCAIRYDTSLGTSYHNRFTIVFGLLLLLTMQTNELEEKYLIVTSCLALHDCSLAAPVRKVDTSDTINRLLLFEGCRRDRLTNLAEGSKTAFEVLFIRSRSNFP